MRSQLNLFIGIYFAAILLVSLLRRASLQGKLGRFAYLFRALFPSWRFFDRAEHAPALYYRVDARAEWKPCLERLPRKFRSIFHNPEGGFSLAAGSLVQQLLSDIDSVDPSRPHDTEGLVSYQLAKNLVRRQARIEERPGPESRFQFKVRDESGDILISPAYSFYEH